MKYLLFWLILCIPFSVHAKWEQCNNGLDGAEISSIAANGKSLWVGTSNGFIYQSTDLGKQWLPVYKEGNSPIIAISTNDNDNICAVSADKIYVSTDGGFHWINKIIPLSFEKILCVFNRGYKILLGTTGSLYISENMGDTFIKSPEIMYNITSFYYKDNNLYSCSKSGIKLSKDFGSSWDIQISDVVADKFVIYQNKMYSFAKGAFLTSSDAGKTWSKWYTLGSDRITDILQMNDTIIFSTSKNLYSNHINENEWNGFINLKGNNFTCLCETENTVFAGSLQGAFCSSDYFHTFEIRNKGLQNTSIVSMCKQDNKIFAATKYHNVFSSSDFGNTWFNDSAGLNNNPVNCLAISHDTVYAGTDSGIFIRNGSNCCWEKLSNQKTRKLAVNGNNIIITDSLDLFYSNNGGLSFFDEISTMEGINVLETNRDKFYIGFSGLFVSADAGKTWEDISSSGIVDFVTTAIAFRDDTIYAGIKNHGVFSSNNGGKDWGTIPLGKRGFEPFALVDINGILIASTDTGVFSLNAQTNKWLSINEGLGNEQIISFLQSGEYLFGGTANLGVYRIKIQDLTDVSYENSDHIQLIYPNPASDYINISVGANGCSPESIKIFDVFGQEEHPPTPSYEEGELRIDVSALPPGVYFVRVGSNLNKFVKY